MTGKYLPDEVAHSLAIETPMIGISWKVFKVLGHIPISTTAEAEGWLEEYDPAKHEALFISHTHRVEMGGAEPNGLEAASAEFVPEAYRS